MLTNVKNGNAFGNFREEMESISQCYGTEKYELYIVMQSLKLLGFIPNCNLLYNGVWTLLRKTIYKYCDIGKCSFLQFSFRGFQRHLS